MNANDYDFAGKLLEAAKEGKRLKEELEQSVEFGPAADKALEHLGKRLYSSTDNDIFLTGGILGLDGPKFKCFAKRFVELCTKNGIGGVTYGDSFICFEASALWTYLEKLESMKAKGKAATITTGPYR